MGCWEEFPFGLSLMQCVLIKSIPRATGNEFGGEGSGVVFRFPVRLVQCKLDIGTTSSSGNIK